MNSESGVLVAPSPVLDPALNRRHYDGAYNCGVGAVSSKRRRTLLNILLETTWPTECGGRDVLRPLWSEEAMRRATNLLQLVLLLERNCWSNADSPRSAQHECALATSLAASFGALDFTDDHQWQSCATDLSNVAFNLVALFGPAVGHISLRSELVRLELPAYKRRALVLVASELVINALKHGFHGLSHGQIRINLTKRSDEHACLLIEDDGLGFGSDLRISGLAVVDVLAGLLEGEMVYGCSALGGALVELQFPVT